MEFETEMGLVAIRENEIDVLESIYDFNETYSKQLYGEDNLGSRKLIQRSVKRLQEHGLIKIVRTEGRKKVIRITVRGIRKLDDEGRMDSDTYMNASESENRKRIAD